MPSSVVVDKKSFNPFFLPQKRKKGESVKLTSEDVNQNTVQEKPAKLAKYDGHETSSNIDEAREKVRSTAPNTASIPPNLKEDLIDLLKCKNELFLQFKKVFSDINESQIHNYYFCTLRNCKEISLDDLKSAKKDNKLRHKWLFDPNIEKFEKTNE